MISMAWVMPSGNLSHQFMKPNGTPSILIIKLTLLGQKFPLSSLQESCPTKITTRKISPNQFPSLLRRHLPFPHFRPSLRAKSTQSQNTSKRPIPSLTWKSLSNCTSRLPNNQQAHPTCLRSKNLSGLKR